MMVLFAVYKKVATSVVAVHFYICYNARWEMLLFLTI